MPEQRTAACDAALSPSPQPSPIEGEGVCKGLPYWMELMQEQATERRSATSATVILPGLAAGHAVFHWVIQSFVVLLPEIQTAFHLNAVGVGGALSAREIASGLVSLPGGIVVDVLRRYWGQLLATCLGAAALGSLVMGVSPVYPLLLLGMVVVGASHSLWHLPAQASLSHHFPEKRGLALSYHGVGGSIGDVAGPLATGALLAVLTWRGLLSIYGAVPIFMAILAFWLFRRIGRARDDEDTAVSISDRTEITKQLLRNPALWGLTAVRGLRGMALVALVTVLPLYLANDLELSTFSRGFHIGLLIAIGLVAKPLAGHLSDRWGRRQVLVPGLVWSCLLSLALLPFSDGLMLTVVVAALGLFLYPDQPIVVASVFDVVGRGVANTGMGVVSCIAFFMSAGSSLLAGALYEGYGFEAVVYYIAALFAVAAVVFAVLPLRGTSA